MSHNRQGACAVDNDGATFVDNDGATLTTSITFQLMADAPQNTDAPWNAFSSHDYWRRNYYELQSEDQEIIRCVSRFFVAALAGRPRVQQGIDVGSGANLYPALLMLPWTEKILLTDFSASNVRWLRHQLEDDDDDATWTWRPFWHELHEEDGYNQISEPRKQLREACAGEQGRAAVEERSVFDLEEAQWDLGTMFFVAESITGDPAEFRAAVARFIGALKPGAPFAAAFMAGSDGYLVAGTRFPALPITVAHVREHLSALGAAGVSVELLSTKQRVREGYAGMIVATGFTRSQWGQ
jgi:NNMT/PNMT/TEMT family